VYYVYLLRSKAYPDQTYIGFTHDLRKRLTEHNAGKSIHTNKFRPWDLMAYVALPERNLAENFERYLKSGSGRAFAVRHLQAKNSPES
jgi:putative endonuclease